mgnify:CR=1 FL=1
MNHQENAAECAAYAVDVCDAKAADSPIASEVKGIRQGQETTSDLIANLTSRLKPVLNHGVNAEGKCAAKPISPSISPLHGDLYSAGERQQALNARLRELIDRITV